MMADVFPTHLPTGAHIMKGDLTKICLPDILRHLYTERRSGELVLTRADQTKRIYFELGNIVFAASNQDTDRIGEVLLRHGLLSAEDFDRAVVATRNGAKRFGKVLVEMGLMSEKDLITNVTFQVLDIIYSLFLWTTGSFEFIEGEHRVEEELKLKLTTASIILEGVRRIEDFDLIRRGLGDLNRLIGPSSSLLLRLQTMTLRPNERKLLDLVTGPTDLLKLTIAAQTEPELTFRAIYGLLSAGLFEQTKSPEISHITGKFEIPEELRENAQPAPPAYAAKTVAEAPPDFAAFQRELENIKHRIAQNNPYIILNVPPNSTVEDINSAYFKLAERFHPDRFLQAPRELRMEIDSVFARIAFSYDLLRQRAMAAETRTNKNPFVPGAHRPPTGAYQAVPPVAVKIPRPAYLSNNPPPQAPPPPQEEAAPDVLQVLETLPQRITPTKNTANLDGAIADLLAYLDDRKAPLFVADSLSLLFRTDEPFFIPRERLAEIVASWAVRRASMSGKPIHEEMLNAVQNIKHAEQARVLTNFDGARFYEGFVGELLTYCPPGERGLFDVKLGGIKELLRK